MLHSLLFIFFFFSFSPAIEIYTFPYTTLFRSMHEGRWSVMLGLRGIPAAAEEIDAVRDCALAALTGARNHARRDRKSTRLNSSHSQKSYGVFCSKKKKNMMAYTGPIELYRSIK